jgi:hypothetical protein
MTKTKMGKEKEISIGRVVGLLGTLVHARRSQQHSKQKPKELVRNRPALSRVMVVA